MQVTYIFTVGHTAVETIITLACLAFESKHGRLGPIAVDDAGLVRLRI